MEQKKLRSYGIIEKLIKQKATKGIKNIHFFIMWLMLALWIFLSYVVFPVFYDVYVIFLFAPLIYAAVIYRIKGAILGSVIFVAVLVPQALPLSVEAYVLVRSFIYLVFPFLVSTLIAVSLQHIEEQMEAYQIIVTLNRTLNDYIEQLEKTQKHLIQVEKLRALGQLSASIAHEINNPLAGVLVYIHFLEKLIKNRSLDTEKALDVLAKMENALTYSSRLVLNLLDFSRQTAPILKPISVSKVIDQAIALVGHQAELGKVKITRDDSTSLPMIRADFNQLQQVFMNLIVNAIQAMPDGGKLKITASILDIDFVEISFQDTGYGISPANMDKLFTPFFSTKHAIKGVGLGLAVSYGIIKRHGGRIEVQSKEGHGSTFSVYLPINPPDQENQNELNKD